MKKRSFTHWMRSLHRDLGFLVIGLTIVFSISGILLVYRGTDLLMYEHHVAKTIDKELTTNELGQALKFRRFRAETKGDSIVFDGGFYIQSTGELDYTYKAQPKLLSKFNSFHKSSTRSTFHLVAIIYAILLFFLAISSLFMFKPGTRKFFRGIVITIIGIVATLLMIFLI